MYRLEGFKVAVLATDGFEESELFDPVEALRKEGATVHLLAPNTGKIQGFRHFDRGKKARVDAVLEDVSPDEYDALHLPGGTFNADVLRMVPGARHFVQSFQRAGKPIAAICHAPWLLISSGVVNGRTLTSYFTLQDDIRNAGGNWLDEAVMEDGNWVTSREPADLPAYIEAILRLFGGRGRGARAA